MNDIKKNEDGFTFNLSVWKDKKPISLCKENDAKQICTNVKPGKGTKEASNYSFQYCGDRLTSEGILKISAKDFVKGKVKITFILNSDTDDPNTLLGEYKFRWLHARLANPDLEYEGKGQRFDMVNWSKTVVSFYLD